MTHLEKAARAIEKYYQDAMQNCIVVARKEGLESPNAAFGVVVTVKTTFGDKKLNFTEFIPGEVASEFLANKYLRAVFVEKAATQLGKAIFIKGELHDTSRT